MEENPRPRFTPKQKAELWKRCRIASSPAISSALVSCSTSQLCFSQSRKAHADFRKIFSLFSTLRRKWCLALGFVRNSARR